MIPFKRLFLGAICGLLLYAPLQSSALSVFVNGVQSPTEPLISCGRVLVPVRFISEQLGARVDWLGSIGRIILKKNNTRITLKENSTIAIVNVIGVSDRIQTLDIPVELRGKKAFVPLRFISETFGADVSWDYTTQTAYINTYGDADASGTVSDLKVK